MGDRSSTGRKITQLGIKGAGLAASRVSILLGAQHLPVRGRVSVSAHRDGLRLSWHGLSYFERVRFYIIITDEGVDIDLQLL